MRPESHDPARRAVERIAASVGPPPPPEGLDARRRRPRIARATVWTAAAAAVVVLVVGLSVLVLRTRGPIAERPADLVVVEHLRVNGRAVPSRVLDLPAAGAVIVLPGTVSHGRLGKSATSDSRIAALRVRSEEYVHDR